MGLVRARLRDGRWTIEEALTGSRQRDPARLVAEWVRQAPASLLALDAPLGWPAQLGRTISRHRAGEAVSPSADALFKRVTDLHVRATYGQNPLEVGASLIARTARAALALLGEVRSATGHAIPLAWSPAAELPAAIEVYPAATLRAHHPDAPRLPRQQRDELIHAWIGNAFDVEAGAGAQLGNPHVRDAAICALAAVDFLEGAALPPTDERTAAKEGWIWVMRPS